jgi:hypothetical protein
MKVVTRLIEHINGLGCIVYQKVSAIGSHRQLHGELLMVLAVFFSKLVGLEEQEK